MQTVFSAHQGTVRDVSLVGGMGVRDIKGKGEVGREHGTAGRTRIHVGNIESRAPKEHPGEDGG